MAYTTVPTITTGDIATAAWGNTYIKDNFAQTGPALVTTDGDMLIATGSNVLKRMAMVDSNDRVIQERGGTEADLSAVTTGDTIVGQSSGVMGLETAMTQGQAEAGSDTQVRGVTAQRIAQAIASQAAGESAAKVWCSITAAGALETNDLNVASVTDVGTGNRDVNYTTAFSSANYTVVPGIGAVTSSSDVVARTGTRTTADVNISCRNAANSLVDEPNNLVGFGAQ